MANYIFDTTKERSSLMSKIRATNTKPELTLRKQLWKLGLRYRLNVSGLKGKPDIVFKQKKLVVFVDGTFWHGYKWADKKPKIKANRAYWIKKIERNIARDIEVTGHLLAMGYTVLRFWEHEIKADLPGCIGKIIVEIKKASTGTER